MVNNSYDLAIIGAGPAGLSAAIYASRYKINFVVVGGEVGGRINETHIIENYPGIPSITGFELGMAFKKHAESLGTKIIQTIAKEIKSDQGLYSIITDQGEVMAKNILFALGSEYRRLKVPGEDVYKGKGVSYCATCDGPFFRGKKVIVVGGGNAAAGAAIMLSEYASHVYLLYRGDGLKCFPVYLDQLAKNQKVSIHCCTNIKEIKGDGVVKNVLLDQPVEGMIDLPIDGIFIEIGSDPSVGLLAPLGVELDDRQFVRTRPDQSTNVEGVYAAGDLTTNSNGFRQVVTAAAEGAIAALSIYEKIKADSAKSAPSK